jgi:DNA-binding XRE family transcriptional regulator
MKTAKPLTREEFAAALSMHRDRLGLTQAAAADLLEVSPRVYWQWEKGQSNALPVTMEGVIARLKVAKKSR